MKISGIYQITSPTNRKYIGFSTDIYSRWNQYRFLSNIKAQKLLYRSMKKYGYSNHKFEILEILQNDLSVLSEREIYWIKANKTYSKENKRLGLNLTKGGNYPNKQINPKTEEHKKKISIANKGKKHSEETKEKIRVKRKMQIFTKEQIKKRSSKLLGVPSKLKGRKRPIISAKLKGKIPAISIPCKLIDKLTGETIKANSIQQLSRISGVSVSSILKIRNGLIVNKYKNYIYEQ